MPPPATLKTLLDLLGLGFICMTTCPTISLQPHHASVFKFVFHISVTNIHYSFVLPSMPLPLLAIYHLGQPGCYNNKMQQALSP